MLRVPHPPCGRGTACVLCQLTTWFQSLEAAPPGGLGPSLGPLVLGVRRLGSHFTAYRQEDAHDFVHAVLDSVHVACLNDLGGEASFDAATRETSSLYHLFGGVTRGAVRCCTCGGVSHSYESFITLALEVSGRHISSLEDALEANFCATEMMSGREAYRCDACAALVTARRSARILVAPNLLAVALKRYSTGFFGKINKRVSFPPTLDIARFMAASPKPPQAGRDGEGSSRGEPPATEGGEPAAGAGGGGDEAPCGENGESSGQEPGGGWCSGYRLFGVLVHLDWALSTAAGHYVCYVRRGSQWYKCDDASVSPVTETQALGQNAYMLFYQADRPQPEPQARPAWVQDTPEEAAEEARRLAAAASARAREAERSGIGMGNTDDDASDGEDGTTSSQVVGVIPDYVLTAFGDQAAPGKCADGSDEAVTRWHTTLVLKVHLPRVKTHTDISVVVEGQQLRLEAAGGHYSMVSTLPYPMAGDFSGEFDTTNNTLSLSLKVLPVPRVPPRAGSSAQPAEPPVPPPPPPRRMGQMPVALTAAIHAHRRRDDTSSSDES